MMDRTLDGPKGMFLYMADSRVGYPDRETHLRHLEAIFAAMAANGLAINLDKCVFAVPTLEFLGHNISKAGLTPAADHAAAIKSCPPPGHQTIATLSGHGEFLPPFFAKLRTSVAPIN
jgi:hypothetical protein